MVAAEHNLGVYAFFFIRAINLIALEVAVQVAFVILALSTPPGFQPLGALYKVFV